MQPTVPIGPAVSAVVCTRNRGTAVVKTIESILACDGPRFEIIVVDQSEDQDTETSIAPYGARDGVNYIRSSAKGLAAARNIRIRSAKSELIAFTDDDCVIGENWLQRIVAAFSQDRRIGIVHGTVLEGSRDTNSGFVPANLAAPSVPTLMRQFSWS